MSNRVTIQDIADSLGLSRNTVSKAINNTGVLADSTRQRVLAKAVEMGYKQFSYMDIDALSAVSAPQAPEKNDIALITTWALNGSHFSATMLDKFQLELSKRGYSMSMHIARGEDIRLRRLPSSIRTDNCAAIICIEVFDEAYARFLSECGIPVLFVDSPVDPMGDPLPADILLMDNRDGILSFFKSMHQRGVTDIGFIGEMLHCRSFFERYMAFTSGVSLYAMHTTDEWCITQKVPALAKGEKGNPSVNFLTKRFSEMSSLPRAFVCANDFVAIDAMNALKSLGYEIPQDVYLLGFDDSSESRVVRPQISTVHIHSQVMGFTATELILSRIKNPDMNYRTCFCESNLILRESTGDTPV